MRTILAPVLLVALACAACGSTGTDNATEPPPTATLSPTSTPMPGPTDPPEPTAIPLQLEFDLTAPGAVIAWQQFLVLQGHDLVVDGVFGPASSAATADWQATTGLPVTGDLDAATFASMAHAPGSQSSPAVTPAATATPRPTRTATPRPTPRPTRTPVPALWIDVKYRDTDVNVAAPHFERLGRRDSTVRDAWYDAGNRYMVIVLGSTAYHYCSMPSSEWSGLQSATNLDGHYEAAIKGNYDCRIFPVPAYSD